MNYCDHLLEQCTALGSKPLMFEIESGRVASMEETLSRVKAAAAYLMRLGVGPGRSVAIHLHNSIDAAVMHMAIQYVGARSCFIDALVQPKSLPYYVKITGATVLITHIAADELPVEVTAVTSIIEAGEISDFSADKVQRNLPRQYNWASNDVCYIYFTSGTTNAPKGVMLTSGNHESFTRICDAYWCPVTEASKHICFVPFSHGFGTIFLLLLAIRTGSELHIMRAFHPLRAADAVERRGITHIYGVPSHYQQLLRLPNARGRLRGLEMAFSAAAKLEHDVMLSWEETTGTILCEGYGLIETCCGVVWRVGSPSLGTGHMGPCPDPSMVEIAILDEDLKASPSGRTGQIAVRGPSVMTGYLGNEAETRRVLRDGWFLSGDKGHITEDGQLFMTGRIKDIINIAGIKVSPYEVEAVLQAHPYIAEAAAVAAPDALYGEVVKGFVITVPNKHVTERELIRFASERLINFQVPKSIEFVDSFPLNNMGKLDRKRLSDLVSG